MSVACFSPGWHGVTPALKVTGIYNPDTIRLESMVVPAPPANAPQLSIDDIVAIQGDATRGKEVVTRCLMCHAVNGTGVDLGPALDGWGRGKSAYGQLGLGGAIGLILVAAGSVAISYWKVRGYA